MLVLGRITGPYGVAGWVKLHAFGDDPLSWRKMPQWWVSDEADSPAPLWAPFDLEGCREHSGVIVVRFAGVVDRSGAEALKGKYIGAPRPALPATGSDEFYWSDLIGLPVANAKNEPLGTVVDLIETGVHAVLRLRDQAGVERLLPFTAQVVKEVKVASHITVDWGQDWGLY